MTWPRGLRRDFPSDRDTLRSRCVCEARTSGAAERAALPISTRRVLAPWRVANGCANPSGATEVLWITVGLNKGTGEPFLTGKYRLLNTANAGDNSRRP
jgi:hypothetical protein